MGEVTVEWRHALGRLLVSMGIVLGALASSAHGLQEALLSDAWVQTGVVLSIVSAGLFVLLASGRCSAAVRGALGLTTDVVGCTVLLVVGGLGSFGWYPVYLVTTLVHGVLLGNAFLHAGVALSVVGFGMAVVVTELWATQWSLTLGLLAALVIAPIQVGWLRRLGGPEGAASADALARPSPRQRREGLASLPLRTSEGLGVTIAVASTRVDTEVELGRPLEAAGYTVRPVDSGLALLELAERETVDVAVLDGVADAEGAVHTVKTYRMAHADGRLAVVVVADAARVDPIREECVGLPVVVVRDPVSPRVLIEATASARSRALALGASPNAADESSDSSVVTSASGPLDPYPLRRLAEFGCGDDGFLDELVESFLEDADARVAGIEAMVRTGNWNGAIAQAHRLKGAAGTIGASSLALSCERLCALGEQPVEPEAAMAAVAEMRAAVEALKPLWSRQAAQGALDTAVPSPPPPPPRRASDSEVAE